MIIFAAGGLAGNTLVSEGINSFVGDIVTAIGQFQNTTHNVTAGLMIIEPSINLTAFNTAVDEIASRKN